VPQAEPPRERRPGHARDRPAAADTDPALAAFWGAVGDTVAIVFAPGIRLLASVLGDPGQLKQPDL
jgi:hypothetical protein